MVEQIMKSMLISLVFLCVLGCEQALFPKKNYPQTPYERYQQLHGRGRMTLEENAYGSEPSVLRDRLRPLSQ